MIFKTIARHVNSLNSKSLSKFRFPISSDGRVYLIAPIHQLNELKSIFRNVSTFKVCLVKPKPYKEPRVYY